MQSELGHCSEAYHDCHLSACCQRGEDHCFLKNENYGQCKPHCDPGAQPLIHHRQPLYLCHTHAGHVQHGCPAATGADPSWSCQNRELPSEANKLTCDSLRDRNNLHRRNCYDLASETECSNSYRGENNVYQPCKWERASRTCEANGQRLECDCALFHRNCPVRPQQHAPSSGAAAAPAEGLSGFEMFVMVFALLIIVAGCGGVIWFGLRMLPPPKTAMADDMDDDQPSQPTRKKKVRCTRVPCIPTAVIGTTLGRRLLTRDPLFFRSCAPRRTIRVQKAPR